MTISNQQLAAQLQETASGWQNFNQMQLGWLTSEDATVTITDYATQTEFDVKTLHQIGLDYEAILGGASSSLNQISQMLTDTQGMIGSVTTYHDAVVQMEIDVRGLKTDCDDAASQAAASAAAAALSAVAADTAKNKAEDWASEDEDVEVANGKFSALHYAAKAEYYSSGMAAQVADAEASALEAEGFRDSAKVSASVASDAKDLAESAAIEAEADRQSCNQHELNCSQAWAYAEASKNEAEDWATKAEDFPVDLLNNKYSALHYAAKAEAAAASVQDVSNEVAQAQQSATDAADSAAEAEGHKDSAEQSASNAEASHTAVLIVQGNVDNSALNAANSSNSAQTYRNQAQSAAGEAEGHSDSAEQFKDIATAMASEAQDWATKAEDVPVTSGESGTEYSALHWAAKAEDSATTAQAAASAIGNYSLCKARSSSNNLNIANVEADLSWGSPVINSGSDVTVSGANITIQNTGLYKITVPVRVGGSNRIELIVRLYLNGIPLGNEIASGYATRDTDQDTGTVTLITALNLSGGNTLKITAEGDVDGTATIKRAGTYIIVERVS